MIPFSKMLPSLTSPEPGRRARPRSDRRASSSMSSSAGDLEVEPADLLRAHRVEREALLVPGVDQLVGRRPSLGQDPEPAERILVLVLGQVLVDRLPAHPVEAVAACDRVARQLVVRALVRNVIRGRSVSTSWSVTSADLEVDRDAVIEQRGGHVLDHLLLSVDRDVAAGQLRHVDVVVLAVVAQVDAGVLEALPVQALVHAQLAHQVHGVLLEQPGADALLHVGPVARLDHHAVDAVAVQQQGQREPRGSGADDAHLGAHGRESMSPCRLVPPRRR